MLRLGGDELDALLALPHGCDAFGGEAIVVVDRGVGPGTGTGGTRDELAAGLAGVPTVVVAVAPAGDDVADVVVSGDDELGVVVDAIAANPDAAVALAVLLRGSATRSIVEGLAVESATYALLQAGPEHERWRTARKPPTRRAAEGEPVIVRREGDVLRLTLDRPHARNAYDAAMRDALVEHLAAAASEPELRVEIDGNGPAFCSGGDLAEFGTVPDVATAHRLRLRRSAGRALAAVAERTVVHVHGACVGAGVELPAFAGRVIARSDATFRLPEVSMGLVPGAGGTVSLPRRIGRQRTAWLAITGTAIDAATARAWELVDQIADE